MDLPGFLTPHTVSIEAYQGTGAYGPRYGAPVASRAYVEDKRRLVRDATGSQVVSETTVYLPLSAGEVPPESRVTTNGRTRSVITTSRYAFGGPTPDHLELALA